MSSCFPLGARWKCFSFDLQDPLTPRILRSTRLHTSSTLRSSKLPACVARLPPWQSGRRTRPWHQRPHCRTLRSSSMHSCSSQFHVIDGFSALHPHNNHITTHNDKDCMPFLPGWNDALGPALLHPAPWMFQRNIGSDAGPACRFSSRRRGSISAWISRHGPWPSPGSSFPLDPQDTSAMHATLNHFF